MKRAAKVMLYLSDSRGIYIPQAFAEQTKTECLSNVSADDIAILLEGPDHESYWDTWEDVCRDAVVTDTSDGTRYTIYQDGDCWLIEEGAQWPETNGEPDLNELTIGDDEEEVES